MISAVHTFFGAPLKKKICQAGTFDNFHFFYAMLSYECIIVFDVSHSRNAPICTSLSHLLKWNLTCRICHADDNHTNILYWFIYIVGHF